MLRDLIYQILLIIAAHDDAAAPGDVLKSCFRFFHSIVGA
jgi:hypothetical protein